MPGASLLELRSRPPEKEARRALELRGLGLCRALAGFQSAGSGFSDILAPEHSDARRLRPERLVAKASQTFGSVRNEENILCSDAPSGHRFGLGADGDGIGLGQEVKGFEPELYSPGFRGV